MAGSAAITCKTRGCVNGTGIDHQGHPYDYCGVCTRIYWVEQKVTDVREMLATSVNSGPRNLDTVNAELNDVQLAALARLDARRDEGTNA